MDSFPADAFTTGAAEAVDPGFPVQENRNAHPFGVCVFLCFQKGASDVELAAEFVQIFFLSNDQLRESAFDHLCKDAGFCG